LSHSELAGRNRSVSGQDRKFPPAPGTNQIAGFREFRPLTSQEKNNIYYNGKNVSNTDFVKEHYLMITPLKIVFKFKIFRKRYYIKC